ncbi:uncharacterized protein LACBIDRAFT_303058 [Laccaria bicolor S238N-H82]|uniref:Predicted protein n=1 Tax=Laccaria bicolor (strain S238N-H82 / ATCC MYA-4686) TaxID=486041 RepID=B0DIV5_LACBS|nr:uncharacterized protein LACBIDRAFT_303058 [Laccaria bicolor S238N-H82]EDR05410.1 predicted protein [Laccaria bicolor S238N-H82]|eukprot:XP_001883968.1 predicted protein [Laccaria bicolor S238N-H82]
MRSADLNSVTKREMRRQLEEQFDMDLTSRKSTTNAAINRILLSQARLSECALGCYPLCVFSSTDSPHWYFEPSRTVSLFIAYPPSDLTTGIISRSGISPPFPLSVIQSFASGLRTLFSLTSLVPLTPKRRDK